MEEEAAIDKLDSKREHYQAWFWTGFAFITLLVGLSAGYQFYFNDEKWVKILLKDFEQLQAQYGAFGDYFGGILNPVLAFASTLLFLAALAYQRAELKEAREMYKEERDSNKKLHDAQIKEFERAADMRSQAMRMEQFYNFKRNYFEVLNSNHIDLDGSNSHVGYIKRKHLSHSYQDSAWVNLNHYFIRSYINNLENLFSIVIWDVKRIDKLNREHGSSMRSEMFTVFNADISLAQVQEDYTCYNGLRINGIPVEAYNLFEIGPDLHDKRGNWKEEYLL